MTQIALSGVIGALSYALDIAEGQPPGHAVRSCLIGMRLAAELDLSPSDRSDLFYALLLKDAGCSANANRMAALFAADDRAAKVTSKLVDWTNPRAAFMWSLRTVAPGTGLRRRIEVLKGIRDEGEVTASSWRPAASAAPRSPGCCSSRSRPPPRSAASTSTGTGAACPTACAARRSRWRPGSCTWRRRSRCSTPPRASGPRGRWRCAGAGAGSTPLWSTRSCASAATGTSGPRSSRPMCPSGSRPTSRSPATTPALTGSPRRSRG